MEGIHPAIVVVAFNRPRSLKRILATIRGADYRNYSNITLVISIDKSEDATVMDVASSTRWEHGAKNVIVHDRHLGLRNHILACGDLSEEYGAVIVLEDDLVVSPAFYDYSAQAVHFYQHRQEVGGISLYAYEMNEYADMRFIPIDDGYDNYFMQTPSSWGQVWTKAQWSEFMQWYESNAAYGVRNTDLLPLEVIKWPESSWKKYFMKYMVEEGKYFIFPRIPLTTNFGDDGVHTGGIGNLLQVPLLMKGKTFRFSRLEDSLAVYDVFFEPTEETVKRFCPEFAPYQFECDFYGTKELSKVKADYLFSSKTATEAVKRFGNEMIPPVSNVIWGVPGTFYSFARTGKFLPLSGFRRLQIIYSQQRILSGLTAIALGAYRISRLLKCIFQPRRKRWKA